MANSMQGGFLRDDQGALVLSAGSGSGVEVRAPTAAIQAVADLFGVRVFRDGDRITTNIDPTALRPTVAGATYYVAPSTASGTPGNAGNTGADAAHPLTPAAALAKSDVGTIIFAPGIYYRADAMGAITKTVNLLAGGPGVILTGYERPLSVTWTLQAGAIYRTTTSWANAVMNVVDRALLMPWGDYAIYQQVADLASIVRPGQWAKVSGVLYVWALGSQDLSAGALNIHAAVNMGSGVAGITPKGPVTVYAEGIDIEGCSGTPGGGIIYPALGGLSDGDSDVPTLIAVNCTSRYSNYNGGIASVGGKSLCVNCHTSSNTCDGFNYHQGTVTGGGAVAAKFVEIGCTSNFAGIHNEAAENYNGSTSHDSAIGVRVNCEYANGYGPTIADVLGAKTWSIGCKARTSRAPTRNYGLNVADAGSELYADTCEVSDHAQGARPETVPMYLRRVRFTRCASTVTTFGGGTAVSY